MFIFYRSFAIIVIECQICVDLKIAHMRVFSFRGTMKANVLLYLGSWDSNNRNGNESRPGLMCRSTYEDKETLVSRYKAEKINERIDNLEGFGAEVLPAAVLLNLLVCPDTKCSVRKSQDHFVFSGKFGFWTIFVFTFVVKPKLPITLRWSMDLIAHGSAIWRGNSIWWSSTSRTPASPRSSKVYRAGTGASIFSVIALVA